jgi:cytochrome P450
MNDAGLGVAAPPAPKAGLFELTRMLPRLWWNPIEAMRRLHAAHGDLVEVSAGPFARHYMVRHPRLVHAVLTRTESFEKPRLASWFKDWFGPPGLVRSEAFRKAAIRSFSPQRTASLTDTMQRAIEPFLLRWEAHARSHRPFDIAADMMQLSFVIASRSLFGADLSAEAAHVDANLMTIQRHYAAQPMRVVLNVPPVLPTPATRSFRRAVREIHTLCDRLVQDRRTLIRSTGVEHAPDDLLTALVVDGRDDQGRPLADDLARNVVMAGLLSSYETTGCALGWASHLLAQHPLALDRIAEEEVRGGGEWVDQVFAESMRLYPPSWVIVRQTKHACELDGLSLKRGATVLISPYLVHRHPEVWRSPELFDPDRFSSDRRLENGSYIPFGAGPHRCFGDHYAGQIVRITLTALASRWRMSLVPGKRAMWRPLISLRPEPGVWVTLSERTGS